MNVGSRYGWWFMPLALVICAAPATSANLKLLDYYAKGGGFVRFRTSNPLPPRTPINREGVNIETAVTPHFTVYVDLDSIEYADKGNYFRYQFYVEPRSETAGEPAAFTVKGNPVGSFLPQMGEIVFELDRPHGPPESGTITLLVFSADEPRYLTLDRDPSEPEEVELLGGKQLFLPLQNLLHLPVKVVDIRQPSAGSDWRQVEVRQPGLEEFQKFQIAPGGKAEDRLFLDLRPGPGAVLKALFSKSSTQEHAMLRASLTCALPWENLPQQSLPIVIPVRFFPWPPYLFLSVALGNLLGSFVPLLLRRRKASDWPRAFVFSLLVASVMEAIAMVLVQLESQFRLFNFELDPFQMLPSFLIGVVMGLLGFKSVDVVYEWFPPLRPGSK